ncbi:phosphotransferase [Thermoactinospora rubra]|uniref:phosphotransferase n=1 Tax=Thermoactinospora rubra TaxID=1088767 RepID=UPI001981E14F|nr:phosphotransferase [Thermoactinospora rubra]
MVPADREALTARVAAARPTDFGSFRQTGCDLLVLGRYGEALDHLDRALELADTGRRRVAVLVNLGDVYRYSGDAPTAELLYRRALELARDSAPDAVSFPLQHLGKALAEQGRLAEARASLEEALALREAAGDAEPAESTRAALLALDRLPIPLPASVAALVGDSPTWSDEHEGRSGSVARVNGTYWVKRGPAAVAEHERLEWLRGQGMRVPVVAAFEDDVLVLEDAGVPSLASLIAGAPGPSPAGGSPATAMGELLRRLHSIPVAACPFDGRLDVMLAQARRRVVEGLVDADDFDDDHRDLTPAQVLDRLLAMRPGREDLVVAHGDYTASNVLSGGVLIDVGHLGVADRYRDLAIAARDLGEDLGPAAVEEFFAAYGLAGVDHERLVYYRLLDELF